MSKSEFLEEISNMNREEIQNMLNKKITRVKKIWPAIILRNNNSKGENKNDSRTSNK